jgi:hypothetical protein
MRDDERRCPMLKVRKLRCKAVDMLAVGKVG